MTDILDRARCLILSVPERAANFLPERRIIPSSIHRWWQRRGKKSLPSTG